MCSNLKSLLPSINYTVRQTMNFFLSKVRLIIFRRFCYVEYESYHVVYHVRILRKLKLNVPKRAILAISPNYD